MYEVVFMDTKYCNGCKQNLPIDSFRVRVRRNQIVARSRCCQCEKNDAKIQRQRQLVNGKRKEIRRRHIELHPEYAKRAAVRAFARRLWIDPEQLLDFVAQHNGNCDICGRHKSEVGTLHIDHDHEKGHIRGMICGHCNLGLGKFRDAIEILENAISYLKKKPTLFKQTTPIPVLSNSKQSEIKQLLTNGVAQTPKPGDYGFNSPAIIANLYGKDYQPIKDLHPTEMTCRACGDKKSIDLFVKRSNKPLGRERICKKCHSAQSKKHKKITSPNPLTCGSQDQDLR